MQLTLNSDSVRLEKRELLERKGGMERMSLVCSFLLRELSISGENGQSVLSVKYRSGLCREIANEIQVLSLAEYWNAKSFEVPGVTQR